MRNVCMGRLGALLVYTAFSSLESAAQTPADSLQWFQEARFGMFIHWSIASAEGLEGSWPIMMPGALPKLGNVTDAEYKAFAQRFNPKAYRPEDWIRLAKAAGQKYMVFTTKHHDGFALFDSKYTNYKVTKTPYGKDVLAELVAAAEREKMPLGFYYSPPDLDHPGYRDISKPAKDTYYGEPARPEWPLYLDYMELQLEELLTRYGKVPVMWFDGFKETPWSPARFEAVIRRLQPKTLINNRLGSLADFDISENVFPRRIPTKARPIVQGTPSRIVRADISNEVPALKDFRPWEMCVPMNETWTYNPNDKQFKSTDDLIKTLVEVASRGGNFLLNVGPKADGTIQSEVEERLLGMGAWLKKNGEAIYGTTYGPIQGHAALRSTARGKQIFLHVFDWPKDGRLRLAGMPGVVRSAMVLANGKTVGVSREGGEWQMILPSGAQDGAVTVVQVTLAQAWVPGSK